MKRILRAGGLAAILAVASLAAPASAGFEAPAEVEFGDDFFDPAQVTQDLQDGADEVTWTRAAGSEGDHNVRENGRLFRSGPIGDETEFNSYSLSASAGSYRYFCELHATRSGGEMVGRLKVRPVVVSKDGETALIAWAEADDQTGNAYRVEWRRQGTRKWKVWKKATSAPRGRFGARGKPTDPGAFATYQLRVRSFVRSSPKRTSTFSPILNFDVSLI